MFTYVAIIKYTSGTTGGEIVKADIRTDAWEKLLRAHRGGNAILSVEMSEVIGPAIE